PHSLIAGYTAQQDFMIDHGFISSGNKRQFTDENSIKEHSLAFNQFLVSQGVITSDAASKTDTAWDALIQRPFSDKESRALALKGFQASSVQPAPPTPADVQKFYDLLEQYKPGIKNFLPPISFVPKGFLLAFFDYIDGRVEYFIKPKEAHAACGCSWYAVNLPVCFQAGATGPSGLISTSFCYGAYVCSGTCDVYVPIGCNELTQYPSRFVGPFPFIYDQKTTLCGFAK
ncbi:MAG: hypothetical protein AAB796_03090, partial [Patescibacteria group bacterium]